MFFREILKFFKGKAKQKELLEMAQQNVNLNEHFDQCFRGKLSFNTIGKESINDLRFLVSEIPNKNL